MRKLSLFATRYRSIGSPTSTRFNVPPPGPGDIQSRRPYPEYGPTTNDYRKRWVSAVVYRIPTPADLARWAKPVLAGWESSGIVQLQGGLPFSVFSPQNMNDGPNASRANLVTTAGSAHLPVSQRTFDRWFNTAAFATPPNFVYGNSGINILDGPGFAMVDFALQKSFPIRESMRILFRAEAANLFNRVNLGMPAATIGGSTYGTIRSLNGDARNSRWRCACNSDVRRQILVGILFGTLGLACAGAQTIFIARHAERTGEQDPPLNEAGKRRAEALSKLLADAGIVYFYTSDTIRTRQTAEPTARRANRPVEIVKQDDFEGLIARIRTTADPAKPTLVICHRASMPRIVKALGGGDLVPLRSDEHDRLIVLMMLPGERLPSWHRATGRKALLFP